MNDDRVYSYFGYFFAEEPKELISIIRTDDSGYFEQWNENLGAWRFILNDSIGETLIQAHEVPLYEQWIREIYPNAFG